MARRSLRPHLNQIRSWVRQGRTDAWVAHQLEVKVQDIEQVKRANDLLGEDDPAEGVVAINDPDSAEYHVSSSGLEIMQDGKTLASEPALESAR